MNLNFNGRTLKRTALALVLGALAGTSYAQSTTGDIVGSVTSADKIQVKSLASGTTREVNVSGDGRFRVSQLPTGTYEVTTVSNGSPTATTRVTVVAGQSSMATFASASSGGATSLDTVNVRALGAANAIDLGSVESRTTFTADKLNSLPVARDVTSVSLLTPGTVSSSGYFGPASFGGASAAENSYYVNGFNVTNLYDSLSFSEIPYQAIDQLDIQTGGYGAKYGFSTGGVTSVNVKRGTNEWKGGFSWTGAPDSLRENEPDTYYNDGSIFRSYDKNSSSSNVYSVWAGGPLIEDKLFVFAMGQFSNSKTGSYSSRGSQYTTNGRPPSAAALSTTGYDYESKTPYWLLKVDWYLNENNHLEYTGFDNSRRYSYNYFNALYDKPDAGGEPARTNDLGELIGKTGGQTDIFKWTSYLTENLTGSIQYGQMRNRSSEHTISPDGVTSFYDGNINSPEGACPYVLDYRSETGGTGRRIGCAVASTVGMFGGRNERKGARADFDWQLGDHKIGFGYSDEKWTSVQGTSYSAGALWYLEDDYANRVNFRNGGSIEIKQKSWYVQDNWQINDNFMLYAGIRNDSFDNKNSDSISFVKQDDIWQPRFGFSWDILGDGRSKLFASAGRYSLPIAANVALRAASASYYLDQYFTYDGINPNGSPIITGSYEDGAYDNIVNGESGVTPDPRAVASKGLKPYTQDEVILGYQQQINSSIDFFNDWTVGIKATYRRANKVIDDTCDSRSLYNAAVAAGYDLSNWADPWTVPEGLPGCWIYNPGSDLQVTLDVDGDGKVDDITVPGASLGPKAKRVYKAVTLSADKQTERWYASFSYTWSKLEGNYEGLVKSTNGQDDTGTTSDFDFAEIMYGSDGYLFNDHRHSIKLYGGFKFTDEWSVGLNMLAQSGAPKSCLGGGWGSFDTEYGYSGVFHSCELNGNQPADDISKVGSAGRTPWQFTVSPNITYTPNWLKGLSVQMSVINAFNNIKPVQVYETKYGRPSSAPTIRTYYNYNTPKYFNDPRYVRFQVQYDW